MKTFSSKFDLLFYTFAVSMACTVLVSVACLAYAGMSVGFGLLGTGGFSVSKLEAVVFLGLSPGFATSLICPFYIVGLRRGEPRCRLYEGLTILAAWPHALVFCFLALTLGLTLVMS